MKQLEVEWNGQRGGHTEGWLANQEAMLRVPDPSRKEHSHPNCREGCTMHRTRRRPGWRAAAGLVRPPPWPTRPSLPAQCHCVLPPLPNLQVPIARTGVPASTLQALRFLLAPDADAARGPAAFEAAGSPELEARLGQVLVHVCSSELQALGESCRSQ